MNCPGRADFGATPFELPQRAARELLLEAADLLAARHYAPAPRTVATLERARIDALLPPDAPENGGGVARLRAILCDEFLPFTRDYRHPLHLGHQRPAPSLASLYADFATAAFNPTVGMFEGGPYAVAVEQRVLGWMKKLAGYPASAVATLVNGGAEAHLTALLAARDRALAAGRAARDLHLVVGEHAHYTLARAHHILGLAPDRIVTVPCRADLATDVAALADRLDAIRRAGGTAMAIVANAGCTANAAFDDLDAIAGLASAGGIWLHVDAAHGGAALLSARRRGLLAGLARADSIIINPHKMFFVSAPCAVLLCRHRALFAASLAVGLGRADYVIPDPAALAEMEDGAEPLRWTLACTRTFAAFKLYAAISAYGLAGLGARIDRACDLAAFLGHELDAAPDFETLGRPAFNMVCFRYAPLGLGAATPDRLNRRIRDRLAAGPDAYLTGCVARGAYWLRAQVMSENVDEASLRSLLPLLRRTAAELVHQPEGVLA
ncbi:aspartate aminotransferase family protein [Dongia sp.]|uniref:pyridoxal phosphate-dependent decarboxylase family protein n=1 Tax=Dongia sp. TaxID=1977262 RepID=UPI0035B1B8FD